MLNAFDLSGKVAIITGGNGGLGLGIAKGLAKAGSAVAIAGRNQDKLDSASAELKAIGAQVLTVQADVSIEDDVNRMVKETVEHFGRVDILVNNAGISWGVKTEEMSLELWDKFMAVDLTSVFLCSKACYPEMVKAGGGKIINISSFITKKGFGKLAHYAAAKGGMDHMSQSLAEGWGKDNIQVNVIVCGLFDTDMNPCSVPEPAPILTYMIEKTPAKRAGLPADLEGLSIFLASKSSDFVTGALIVIDGGFSLAI